MKKVRWVDALLVAGVVFLALGIGMEVRQRQEGEEIKIEKDGERIVPRELGTDVLKKNIFIEMAGEVEKPGVYEFDQGARVQEALVKAGGLGAGADREWVEKNINKARVLRDGEKIYIPKLGEVLGEGVLKLVQHDMLVETGKININTASQTELETLTGIGPSLAGRIIEYRTNNNGFVSIEEIKLVSGIGEKMYEKIMNEIEI